MWRSADFFASVGWMSDNDTELVWHDAHSRGEGLMVVLHGAAEHPVAAMQVGSMLDPRRRFRVCAPVSAVQVGEHKRSFYRSRSPMQPRVDSFRAAVGFVSRSIDAACAVTSHDRADVCWSGSPKEPAWPPSPPWGVRSSRHRGR